jgi:hypothetical protein
MIKLVQRILLITLTLFTIAVFMVFYALTVTLIKPRDITKGFNHINNYFISNDKQAFTSKKVILLWNKDKFSFELEFLDNGFYHLNQLISIPNAKVDFDIMDLFKLQLGKIYINHISYKVDSNIKELNSRYSNIIALLYNKDTQKVALSEDFIKKNKQWYNIIAKLNNVEIKIIDVIGEDNKVKYKVENLAIKNYNLAKGLRLSGSFLLKDKLKFDVKASCLKNDQSLLNNCTLFFKNLHAKSKNNYIHANLRLELLKITGDNYHLLSNAQIKHIIYQGDNYRNIDLVSNINIKEALINRVDLDLKHLDKNLSLLAVLLENKRINLNISGNNLSEKEVFLLWQEKFAYNTRKWLGRSLLKANLKKFFLELELDLNKKNILTKLAGEFYANNSNLKFHDKYGVIKNATALVKLEKNKLDIEISEAFIEGEKIVNTRVFIPYMAKGKSILNIKTQSELPANKIIDFLLAYRVKSDKLTKLKQLFLDNKLLFDLDLAIKLNKRITSRDVKLNIDGWLGNLSKNFFKKDSQAKLSLKKNLANLEYLVNIDYSQSAINLPIITYVKKKSDNFQLSFAILANHNKLLFKDIQVVADNAQLSKASFTLQNSIISQLDFANMRLDKNYLSIKLINDKIHVDSQKIILKKFNFTEKSSSKLQLGSKFLVKIDELFFADRLALSNLYLMANCIKKCSFITMEANLDTVSNNKILEKVFLQYNNQKQKKELVVETNNIGYILHMIHSNNKIDSGSFRLKMSQEQGQKIVGKAYMNNFAVLNTNMFNKLLKLNFFKKKKSVKQKFFNFDKAKADFYVKDNILNVTTMTSYGSAFGFTAQGEFNMLNKDIDFNGVIVPAYHLNNLLGIKNIPILGKLITGSDNKGLISASYNVKGNIANNKISVNPLTIIMPSFMKDIKELF